MYGELASVRGVVDLPPQVALDAAQGFLARQGYTTTQRTDTKVTATRRGTNPGDHDILNLTVAVEARPQGGVRIKVRGNDQAGVRERQAEWMEWAESLPKKAEQAREPDAQPTATATATPPPTARERPAPVPPGYRALRPRPHTTWQRRLTLFVINVLLVGTLSLLFLIFGGLVGLVAGAVTQSVVVGLIVGILAGGGIVAYVWLRSIVTNEVIDILVEDASRVWRRGQR